MTDVIDPPANLAAGLIDPLIQSNRGDRQAFMYNGRRYSFHDVAALMNRAGNLFRSWPMAPGSSVLVLLRPSPAHVAALLGAMKAGFVPLLGDASLDANDVARICAAATPSAALVHEDRVDAVEKAAAGRAMTIAVVGGDAGRHVALADALREQASWLAPQPLAPAAPALAWWTGNGVETLSRAALDEALGGAGAPAAPAAIIALLRAFAAGEEATLG